MPANVSVRDIAAVRQFASQLIGFANNYAYRLAAIRTSASSDLSKAEMTLQSLRNAVHDAETKQRQAEREIEHCRNSESATMSDMQSAQNDLDEAEQVLRLARRNLERAEELVSKLKGILNQVESTCTRGIRNINNQANDASSAIKNAADKLERYAR